MTIPSAEPIPELDEHLRSHLTDGAWHDGCYWCLRRRLYGGTGVQSWPQTSDLSTS